MRFKKVGHLKLGKNIFGETQKRRTLPETHIFAPKNGWLEYDPFLLGRLIFRGELLVSGGVTFHHPGVDVVFFSPGVRNPPFFFFQKGGCSQKLTPIFVH